MVSAYPGSIWLHEPTTVLAFAAWYAVMKASQVSSAIPMVVVVLLFLVACASIEQTERAQLWQEHQRRMAL